MKTLEEKVAYNEKRNSGFSKGYCVGVRFYQNYGKGGSPVDKQKHNEYIDDMKSGAGKYSYCKGFMCGVRDAANERKNKVIKGSLNAVSKVTIFRKNNTSL